MPRLLVDRRGGSTGDTAAAEQRPGTSSSDGSEIAALRDSPCQPAVSAAPPSRGRPAAAATRRSALVALATPRKARESLALGALPIAWAPTGAPPGFRSCVSYRGARLSARTAASASRPLVGPLAPIGLASLEGVETGDEGGILRLRRASADRRARHRPRLQCWPPLRGVMSPHNPRGVGESKENPRAGAAPALPTMPSRLERSLRRGAVGARRTRYRWAARVQPRVIWARPLWSAGSTTEATAPSSRRRRGWPPLGPLAPRVD